MLDGLGYFLDGVARFATPGSLFSVLWATLLGICVGMLPGLTATLGIALLTTLTFTLEASDAILILICMYVGAIYGGSRSAILLNIPGTPANAATSLDGFPLARAGEAGKAMGIATAGSVCGSLVGMVFLAVLAPVLAEFALQFGAFEFFWLAVFGVVISGQLPALVGAFGFAEILIVMRQSAYEVVRGSKDSVIPKLREVARYWRTVIRSGTIGTFMGLIPGVGEDMGAWVSYAVARKRSRTPDSFGKGSQEGLISAEAGNNSAVSGAIIPVLTLAVPGSAPAAVLLAAILVHGVRPGPLIMIESPAFVFEVVAMVFYASLAILLYGLLLARPMLKVLAVPRERLMPVIFVLCTVGAFAIASRSFDIWVMLAFGVLGFALREMKYPMAPLVLGIVLGDILDKNFRRGMVLSDGSLEPFFFRPISGVLAAATLATILLSIPAVRRGLSAGLARLRPPAGRGKEEDLR
jgi:putative tricarboxylic transport membrane protein